jgi:hypothetical protein
MLKTIVAYSTYLESFQVFEFKPTLHGRVAPVVLVTMFHRSPTPLITPLISLARFIRHA